MIFVANKYAIKKIRTLGKGERLKSRKVIGNLFHEGRSFAAGPIKGLYIIGPTSADPLKCGFTVSSRTFKRAVDRNRIKRLMREAYRLQKLTLKDAVIAKNMSLNIFIIFRGNELPDYSMIFERMQEVILKLIRFVHETIPSAT